MFLIFFIDRHSSVIFCIIITIFIIWYFFFIFKGGDPDLFWYILSLVSILDNSIAPPKYKVLFHQPNISEFIDNIRRSHSDVPYDDLALMQISPRFWKYVNTIPVFNEYGVNLPGHSALLHPSLIFLHHSHQHHYSKVMRPH